MGSINLEGDLWLNESPLLETYITHLYGILSFTHIKTKALVLWECQKIMASGKGDCLEAREDSIFSDFLTSKHIILNSWLAL